MEENTIKISFSAVTHIGAVCTKNDNRIFADGRFLHPSMADFAQISLTVDNRKSFFALSENMEDEESGISLNNDLKKFHQKAISSSKDIHVKLDELVQCVEQSTNLLHSISFGEEDFCSKKPSFAGILIDEGNIAAVNLGNSRIYKLEGDTFKLLVNDYKRAERLLKMGIISNEQAEMLSGQQRASMDEGRSTVKKSDVNTIRSGIVYLICSSGLVDSVSEDRIYDILASNSNPDEAAGQLVMEAVNNEAEDNITVLVTRVEDAGADQIQVPGIRSTQYRPAAAKVSSRQARVSSAKRRRTVDVSKVVSLVVLAFLFVAVVLGGFRLWTLIRNPQLEDASTQNGDTPPLEDNSSSISSEPDDVEDYMGDNTGTESPGDTDPDETVAPDPTESNAIGPEGITYTVKAGDMLMSLAKRFYGDESKYKLIMEKNNITDPDKIMVGQKLLIPPLE